MRVLITGATGFVGKHLLAQLAQGDDEVRCATRSDIALDGFQTVCVGEISPNTDWSAALQNIDCVIHLAARVHVMKEVSANPEALFDAVNAQGTENLARQAAQQGVSKFIYLSSIKVNGEKTAFDEAFSPDDTPQPQDAYGRSKYKGEQALRGICADSAMDFTIIRPPLVYGPGVKANFQTLIKLAEKNLPMPFGCLKNIRNMIYVKNLCDFICFSLHSDQANNEIFLVRDQEDLEFRAFYRFISAGMGKKAHLFPVPVWLLKAAGALLGKSAIVNRLSDPLRIDAGKMLALWTPPYSLEQTIRETLQAEQVPDEICEK